MHMYMSLYRLEFCWRQLTAVQPSSLARLEDQPAASRFAEVQLQAYAYLNCCRIVQGNTTSTAIKVIGSETLTQHPIHVHLIIKNV